ncbi:MAG TPA: alpha/beta hydrolase [Thermodesulfovibrionales bacterium]|nr:alpha/beta hydrolase [Thermodesulfovibrionales bacterium]
MGKKRAYPSITGISGHFASFEEFFCDILNGELQADTPEQEITSEDSVETLPNTVKRMLLLVAAGLVLGYLLLIAYVYAKQGSMLYFPAREIEATPRNIGLDYHKLTLLTKDGLNISAWFIPADNARGFVLFCHGNAGNISHRLDSIRIFHDLRLSVFIFDYRGYGKSEGSPNEKGTYLDAEAGWDYLRDVLHVDPGRIIIFGRSLGSAVAAEVALRKQTGILIMESGFTSVPALGKKFFPHLPVSLISRYHYESIGKVGRLRIPKLFIHSPEDEIVPFEHGLMLFERASEPKEFLRITGGHNEGFLVSGREYVEGLKAYLSRYLPG